MLQLLNNVFKVCRKSKNADNICYKLATLVSLRQGNVKNSRKSIEIDKKAKIKREILHNLLTTRGISIKFSEKIWFMTILKVTKKPQAFILPL